MQSAGDTRARNIVIARNEMTKQSSKYKSAPFGAALFTWIPWSSHGMNPSEARRMRQGRQSAGDTFLERGSFPSGGGVSARTGWSFIWLTAFALLSPYSCLCPPTKSYDFAGPGVGMTIVLVMHKKHSPQATHMCRATSLTGLPRVATLARNDKSASRAKKKDSGGNAVRRRHTC